jgi:hypothetical protein
VFDLHGSSPSFFKLWLSACETNNIQTLSVSLSLCLSLSLAASLSASLYISMCVCVSVCFSRLFDSVRLPVEPVPHDARQRRHSLGVAVQVAFESKGLKPGAFKLSVNWIYSCTAHLVALAPAPRA